jgi:hypothetical protein
MERCGLIGMYMSLGWVFCVQEAERRGEIKEKVHVRQQV